MTETTREKSPKKPEDRKPAAGELVGTFKGKSFKIAKDVFEDYEFLELSGEIDSNPTKLPALLKLIFGDKGHDRLKDAVRDDDGRVKTPALMEAYQAVMESARAGN